MFEVGFFLKCAHVSTGATVRLDCAFFLAVATIVFPFLLKE